MTSWQTKRAMPQSPVQSDHLDVTPYIPCPKDGGETGMPSGTLIVQINKYYASYTRNDKNNSQPFYQS
jgi:hypothetical protein